MCSESCLTLCTCMVTYTDYCMFVRSQPRLARRNQSWRTRRRIYLKFSLHSRLKFCLESLPEEWSGISPLLKDPCNCGNLLKHFKTLWRIMNFVYLSWIIWIVRFSCGTTGYSTLLEQSYPLPSIRTLQRRMSKISFKPGVLNHVFDFMKLKVSNYISNIFIIQLL